MTGARLERAAWLSLALLCTGSALRASAQEGSPPAAGAEPSSVVGPPRGRPLAGQELEARTEEVAGLLRCPVCQGLSVADSPATLAVAMKARTREMLAAGFEEEQILSYFESSYGEFVRLSPQLRGVNWLVWLAPVLGLITGVVVVAWVLRSRARPRREAGSAEPGPPEPAAVPGPDTLPDDPELARYVLRVRELAYGWPGGRLPAPSSAPPQAPRS